MFPLDARTVGRLAEAIADLGGPYERRGYQLAELLERAGWADPPEYDGSPRIGWLREQLEERAGNRAEIERLLCRVCDPIEYDDGAVIAEQFQKTINEKLAPEGLAVSYVSGRPVIGEIKREGEQPSFAEPPDFGQRIARLIADERTVDTLVRRLDETRICESGGAYTMAVIGIGSLVEGMLLQLLVERDEELFSKGFQDAQGRNVRKSPDRVSLKELIDIAHGKNWIQLDAAKFVDTVRDFRNFVHPRKELSDRLRLDRDTVMMCWGPMNALLNDLEENVTPL